MIQKHRLDECKDSCVGADSERERDYDYRGQTGFLEKDSKRVAHVLAQVVQECQPPSLFLAPPVDIQAGLPNARNVAKATKCFLAGFVGCPSRLDELFRSHLDVEVELVTDIGMDIRAPEPEITPPHRCPARAPHDCPAQTGRSVELRILATASAKRVQLDVSASSCCRPLPVRR